MYVGRSNEKKTVPQRFYIYWTWLVDSKKDDKGQQKEDVEWNSKTNCKNVALVL